LKKLALVTPILKKFAHFGFQQFFLLSRLTLEKFSQPGGGAELLFLMADTLW
jgi:hypothetical protein